MQGLHTKENGTVSWNGNVIAIDKELAAHIEQAKEALTTLTASLQSARYAIALKKYDSAFAHIEEALTQTVNDKHKE